VERAVIFDFDDTLVYTNEIFDAAKSRFYALMRERNLFDKQLPQILNNIDIANVKRAGGLCRSCFPDALRQTYLYYCRLKLQPADEKIAAACADLGWQVYKTKPTLVPGAESLLQKLKGHYRLYLMTQGDIDSQKQRMETSGLLAYFHDYKIVKAKNKLHFQQLIKDKNIDKKGSWSVGNSLRSDINPALLAGLNAIHVQIDCWDYESTKPLAGYYQVASLPLCHDILLNNSSDKHDKNEKEHKEDHADESSCNTI
jgi:putative hydrolase of the HAD superfamily